MMKRRLLVLGFILLTLCCLTVAAQAADYNPLRVSSSCEPANITGAQEVTVTIRVLNSADGDMPDEVRLLDPNGNQVQSVPSLAQNSAMTYSGKWSVTSAQLDAGRIPYKVEYTMYDDEGNSSRATRAINVAIKRTTVAANMTADYTVSPTMANQGQTVTFTYILRNEGNVTVNNIQIQNSNITDQKLTAPAIPPGGKETVTFQYTMGSKTVTSKPRITYRGEGNDTVLTISNMSQKTIELAKSGLTVNLKATGETTALPGSQIELTCTITNSGNLSYTRMSVVDQTLGTIGEEFELKPGEKKELTKTVQITETVDYVFTVSGMDSTGAETTLVSNIIPVIAIDPAKQLNLEVSVDVQNMTIREKPTTLLFTITVRNLGETDATDLTVKHGTTTIGTIDLVPAGEEVQFVRQLAVSMEGKFMFTITGADEQGVNRSFDTNELQIAYIEPTPEPPPPTEEPTPDPDATPTPAPTQEVTEQEGGGGVGVTVLYVMAGILILAILAVVLLVLLNRRNKREDPEETIDTFEFRSRRDYTGANQGRRRQGQQGRRAQAQDGDEGDMEGETEPEDGEDAPDLAALYGRPAQKDEDGAVPPAQPEEANADQLKKEETGAVQDESLLKQETVRYNKEQVAQLRRAEEEKKKRQLMDGETGHYHLSRTEKPKGEEIEVEVEEDDEPTDPTPRRRRRSQK